MWYVKENEILSLLPSEDLLNLKHFGVHKLMKKGTIIYHPNDRSDYVYMIKKGLVKLARVTKEGHQISFSILDKGMLFGEGDALNEETYTHYAETMEPSYICAVHKADFQALLAKYDVVNKRVTEIMYRRLKEAQEQVELLAYSDVKARLIHYLRLLKDRFGKYSEINDEEVYIIDLKISQNELADFIATSRESVNRVLKDLKERDIIDLKGKRIVLKPAFWDIENDA